LTRLRLFEEPVCAGCGVPEALGICACTGMAAALLQVRAVGPFSGWLRDAIHSFKYHHEWARVEHLGPQLAKVVDQMQPVDALVPVPLHRSRLRERGFNQSTVLATMVGDKLGIPVLSALERTRATAQQTGLSAAERRLNVEGAFAVSGATDLRGAQLLLIDDVVTTGAVLNACATTLRRGGAASVRAATLARQLTI
jgi:ComF family protein